MSKRAVAESFCQDFSLDVLVGVQILLVVEQSSLESHSRGCAKTPILTVIVPQSPFWVPNTLDTTIVHLQN